MSDCEDKSIGGITWAHSDDQSMRLLDVRRAIANGNEDCVGLMRLTVHRCEHFGCLQKAEFLSDAIETRRRTGKLDSEGNYFCRKHAELWAAQSSEGEAG